MGGTKMADYSMNTDFLAGSSLAAACSNRSPGSLTDSPFAASELNEPLNGVSLMDEAKALTIVAALANGVNPLTGEIFPADSPYQSADVVRALYCALRLFESGKRRMPRAELPRNAGKPWSEEEDQRLLEAFDRGQPLEALAQAHARTRAGIQARLERHGRLQLQPLGVPAGRLQAARSR
jgi:hypothetical protein